MLWCQQQAPEEEALRYVSLDSKFVGANRQQSCGLRELRKVFFGFMRVLKRSKQQGKAVFVVWNAQVCHHAVALNDLRLGRRKLVEEPRMC